MEVLLEKELKEKIGERHRVFNTPACEFMSGQVCYKDALLYDINREIDELKSFRV